MWLLFGQRLPAGRWASANEQFKSRRWKQARPDSLPSIGATPSLLKTSSGHRVRAVAQLVSYCGVDGKKRLFTHLSLF